MQCVSAVCVCGVCLQCVPAAWQVSWELYWKLKIWSVLTDSLSRHLILATL